ncbi:MAG: hypothetical protein ABI382_00090 [Nakamurella sp.]
MSLRDKLRGLRGGETIGTDVSDGAATSSGIGGSDASSSSSAADENSGNKYDAVPGVSLSGTSELSEFAPRQDGDYYCADRGLHLRFARPVVTESDTAEIEPARGEFTTSGRFAVQRRFSRPIVYTVLSNTSVGGGTARLRGDDAVLTVRRTDTETRSAERLEFAFEADDS